MRPPAPRGPISARVLRCLEEGTTLPASPSDATAMTRVQDPLGDDDFHLALWVLYELHFRGFDAVDPAREWDVGLLAHRAELEAVFEDALRCATRDAVADAHESTDDVVEQIRHLIAADDGPDVARYVHREATVAQFRELMMQRSVYTLKEADPSSFVLPRLDGPVKAALAELQYDEYGGGRPERLHATLFARALAGCGLDPTYGAYVDQAPGRTLAVNNAASYFGLHRRLRGAALGHLATFEATSSLPCRRVAAGIRRLELGDAVWDYFDEHVEADAVHEEVALRSICAVAVAAEPELRHDILFGSAACLLLESAAGTALLDSWRAGRSSLHESGERLPA